MHNRLFKTIPKADSYIKNSFELVEKLKSLHITGAHKLISLDVTLLFRNVPIEVAVDCVNEQWRFISMDCSLPKDEFLEAVRFVLDSTFFPFDNRIYKQKLRHSHGLVFITCGLNNEEIRDGILDVVKFGYFVLLQIC